MKTIIYYYSMTGNCERLAGKIAAKLECDCEKIIEQKKRISKGFLRFLSGSSAIRKKVGKINPVINEPENFEKIIIITPFWVSSPIPAIRGFTEIYKKQFQGKKLGLILTNLGTDPEEVFLKYQKLFPESLITTSFTRAKGEWDGPKEDEKINSFLLKFDEHK